MCKLLLLNHKLVFSVHSQALKTLAKKHPNICIIRLGTNSLLFCYIPSNSPSCSHVWTCTGLDSMNSPVLWCLTDFLLLNAADAPLSFSLSLSLSDATDLSSIKQCATQVGSLVGTGGLNLLINNAGYLAKGKLLDTTPEDMHVSFNTNVVGPMNIIKVRQKKIKCHVWNTEFQYCISSV